MPRPKEEAKLAEPAPGEPATIFPQEFRTIDGSNNHLDRPEWGMVDQPFRRRLRPDYSDGFGTPAGAVRPSAREISNAVAAQDEDQPNRRGATDFLWQWGQFLDHDIDETPVLDPPEPFDIPVPAGDPWFDPFGSGDVLIALDRSFYVQPNGIREQINGITAYIDASNVYGSDTVRAYALRRLDGTGMLKTTPSDHGDLLPYNEGGHANAPEPSSRWFIAGDVRANEQAALTAMHTLFVREHNHWALAYREANPSATEDEVYEFARMIVGAEMQHITYTEFLPLLLGPDSLPPYRGFRPELDPSILNEFATAAYRFGHSLLPTTIRRINADGSTDKNGDLELAEAFFDPSIIEDGGIDTLLRGLASQRCQELDGRLVDGVRNFLFGPPGAGGFDLASLNIQRGRDHGLPSYNDARRQLGMPPARNFRDVHPDRRVADRLAEVYTSVEDIDLWVGGLCEPHVPEAMVGPVFHRILTEQFIRLRDGDRFFYRSALEPETLALVEQETLASVIRRNTELGEELQDNVFLVPDAGRGPRRSIRR
ncbi:heme peroxidase [Haloferula helveola]|uniref:Heme peroxidase n=2 Tax=Haloferula helveola TaxID=490095 RepID=A0ABN6H4Z2_9BACT|nr:heme peroxidase [Haloferula helveola]